MNAFTLRRDGIALATLRYALLTFTIDAASLRITTSPQYVNTDTPCLRLPLLRAAAAIELSLPYVADTGTRPPYVEAQADAHWRHY